MSFLAVFVGILTIGGAHISFKIPSEVEMVDSFGEAQRFYAEGAYDQAIEGYLQVSQIRSRILDAQSIQVTVGEETYPVQEAAIYQIGNAQGKVIFYYGRSWTVDGKEISGLQSFTGPSDNYTGSPKAMPCCLLIAWISITNTDQFP